MFAIVTGLNGLKGTPGQPGFSGLKGQPGKPGIGLPGLAGEHHSTSLSLLNWSLEIEQDNVESL